MSSATENQMKNAAMRQQVDNMVTVSDKYTIGHSGIGQSMASIETDSWGTQQNIARAIAKGQVATRPSIHIMVSEVENGRLLQVGHRQYIVPTGTPLLDVIGQALVEAQLEK